MCTPKHVQNTIKCKKKWRLKQVDSSYSGAACRCDTHGGSNCAVNKFDLKKLGHCAKLKHKQSAIMQINCFPRLLSVYKLNHDTVPVSYEPVYPWKVPNWCLFKWFINSKKIKNKLKQNKTKKTMKLIRSIIRDIFLVLVSIKCVDLTGWCVCSEKLHSDCTLFSQWQQYLCARAGIYMFYVRIHK